MVLASLSLPNAIITEAALSFLGAGIQLPEPSWGNLLSGGNAYLLQGSLAHDLPGTDDHGGRPVLQHARRWAARRHRYLGTPDVTGQPTGPLAAEPTAALLQVQDLVVDLRRPDGTVHAVRGLTYSLNRGESLGIVGESGSGKTISALTLLGLLPPGISRVVRGRVLFEGHNVVGMSESSSRPRREHRHDLPGAHDLEPGAHHRPPAHRVARAAPGDEQEGSARPGRGIAGNGGHPQRPEPAGRLPAPIQRRDEAAGHDRHRGRVPTQDGDRRRAHHRPGLAPLRPNCSNSCFDHRRLPRIAGAGDTQPWGGRPLRQRIYIMYAGKIVEQGLCRDIFYHGLAILTPSVCSKCPPAGRGPRPRLVPIVGTPPNLIDLPPHVPFFPRCPERSERCHVDPGIGAGRRRRAHGAVLHMSGEGAGE